MVKAEKIAAVIYLKCQKMVQLSVYKCVNYILKNLCYSVIPSEGSFYTDALLECGGYAHTRIRRR